MIVRQLDLQNFRNISYTQVTMSEGINLFVGANGQGKTSILEGLSLFAFGRSVRAKTDKDMIQYNQPEARLRAACVREQRTIDMAMRLTQKGKQIAVNRVVKRNLSEFLGQLYAVLFTPDDLQLIKGGPDERRRFLNLNMAQYIPHFLPALHAYNELLTQRNQLLKVKQTATIDVWDMQLSAAGARLMQFRHAFVRELSTLAAEQYSTLSGSSEEPLRITYQTATEDADLATLEESLYQKLQRSIAVDLMRGYTTVGPHRDDLTIEIAEQSASRYASQGQQRSIVLALKLGLVEQIYKNTNQYPILLLDDVLSELDPARQSALLALVSKTQTLITSTRPEIPAQFTHADLKVFDVSRGIIMSTG